MAFSDAFLSGFKVGKYKDEENQQLLSALLNRRSSGGGSAIAPARVVGGGDPLERVNRASKEYEAEQLREEALKMVEQEQMQKAEQENIRTEQLRRTLAAQPTQLDSALDRSTAAAGQAHVGAVARELEQPVLTAARQNDDAMQNDEFLKMIWKGYVNRDMEMLTKGFNGAYNTSGINREQLRGRDEKTGKEMDYMKFENQQTNFRTDEMGNTYVKYAGSDEEVPFNDQHALQFVTAGNRKLWKPVEEGKATGAKTAAATPGTDVGGAIAGESDVDTTRMTEKDKATYLVNQQKADANSFEVRRKYAENQAKEVDGTINPEKFQKAWSESGKMLGSEEAQKQVGFPRPKGYNVPVAEHAGAAAADQFVGLLDGIRESQGAEAAMEAMRRVQAELLTRYGPNAMLAFGDKVMLTGPEWFTGHKLPDKGKLSKTIASGMPRPKSDVAKVELGVPKEVDTKKLDVMGQSESITVDGTPVASTPWSAPPLVYDFDIEDWRPITAKEAATLKKNMEHAYNSGSEESRALLDKAAKLVHKVNTYGTWRKKGELTTFEKLFQDRAAGPKTPTAPVQGQAQAAAPSSAPAPAPAKPAGETPESVYQKYLIARDSDQLGMLQSSFGDTPGLKIGPNETKESIWKIYQAMLARR
jgi:hypothetical protein